MFKRRTVHRPSQHHQLQPGYSQQQPLQQVSPLLVPQLPCTHTQHKGWDRYSPQEAARTGDKNVRDSVPCTGVLERAAIAAAAIAAALVLAGEPLLEGEDGAEDVVWAVGVASSPSRRTWRSHICVRVHPQTKRRNDPSLTREANAMSTERECMRASQLMGTRQM